MQYIHTNQYRLGYVERMPRDARILKFRGLNPQLVEITYHTRQPTLEPQRDVAFLLLEIEGDQTMVFSDVFEIVGINETHVLVATTKGTSLAVPPPG